MFGSTQKRQYKMPILSFPSILPREQAELSEREKMTIDIKNSWWCRDIWENDNIVNLFIDVKTNYPKYTMKDWEKKFQYVNNRRLKCRDETSKNITFWEFLKMWDNQKGECLICPKFYKKKLSPIGKSLSVLEYIYIEHNHETDEVRGLVCHYCNSVLGLAKESISRLAACICCSEGKF